MKNMLVMISKNRVRISKNSLLQNTTTTTTTNNTSRISLPNSRNWPKACSPIVAQFVLSQKEIIQEKQLILKRRILGNKNASTYEQDYTSWSTGIQSGKAGVVQHGNINVVGHINRILILLIELMQGGTQNYLDKCRVRAFDKFNHPSMIE